VLHASVWPANRTERTETNRGAFGRESVANPGAAQNEFASGACGSGPPRRNVQSRFSDSEGRAVRRSHGFAPSGGGGRQGGRDAGIARIRRRHWRNRRQLIPAIPRATCESAFACCREARGSLRGETGTIRGTRSTRSTAAAGARRKRSACEPFEKTGGRVFSLLEAASPEGAASTATISLAGGRRSSSAQTHQETLRTRRMSRAALMASMVRESRSASCRAAWTVWRKSRRRDDCQM